LTEAEVETEIGTDITDGAPGEGLLGQFVENQLKWDGLPRGSFNASVDSQNGQLVLTVTFTREVTLDQALYARPYATDWTVDQDGTWVGKLSPNVVEYVRDNKDTVLRLLRSSR